jgi:hypothetical protein
MVEEFLKQGSFLKQDVQHFKKWFPGALLLFKRVVDRQTQVQLKLLKFHLCTHFADDILKWGLPSAYNSSTGESNHKMLKRRSQKTQRQQNLIEEQTGVRYIEHIALQQSLNCCINKGFDHSSIQEGGHLNSNSSRVDGFSGYSYYMTKDGIFEVSGKKKHEFAGWYNRSIIDAEIFDLLDQHVLPNLCQDRIDVMTVFKNDGNLYRGDPSFKKGIWQDWAYCNWGEQHGLIPIQILLYIDLTMLQTEFEFNGVVVSIPGPYAIVHMIQASLDSNYLDEAGETCNYKAHDKSILFYKARKMMDETGTRPQLALVSTESIAAPCVGVSSDPDELLETHTYIFMKSRYEWPDLLIQAMKDGLRLKKIV